MAKKIFKFELSLVNYFTFRSPGGREGITPLSVGEQNGKLFLWAIVDAFADDGQVSFCIRGTGHQLDGSEGDFVGTCQMSDGLVWHVFFEK